MTRFNERLGATATANRYTSLDERIKFIRAMVAMMKAKASQEALLK
jgi:hypothetical protein